MIQLIAMDFDWTLIKYTEDGYEIHPQLLRYLEAFIRDGGYAGIVSGRGPGDMERMLADKQIPWGKPFPNYCVQCESMVYHWRDGQMRPDAAHNAQLSRRIEAAMRTAAGCMERWMTLLEQHDLPVYGWSVNSRYAAELQMYGQEPAQRAMELLAEDVAVHGLTELEVVRNGVSATVGCSVAGKGNTLAYVAESLGLAPQEVLAVGDSLNDRSMTDGSHGFYGGAVGNAAPQLKAAVQQGGGFLTDAVACDGVLDILRQAAQQGLIKDYGILFAKG